MLLDHSSGHLGIGKDPADPGETPLLHLPGLGNPGPHGPGAFPVTVSGQIPKGDRGHLNLQVKSHQDLVSVA